ncbi:MAG TPA: hypothetical protein VK633_00800 [Verrucomicrobiae bacterium]|nr:hypothetical protein [Verrucomicrobiae bacterium]
MSFFLPANNDRCAKRRKLLLLTVAGLLVFGILIFKPLRAGFRSAYSRKLLAEAQAYLAQNRKPEALLAVRSAVQKGDFSFSACRILLKASGPEPSQEAARAWQKLAQRSELSNRDRCELADYALGWRVPEWVEQQWVYLQKESPLTIDTLRIGAALYDLKGDPKKAAAFARALLEQSPSEERQTRLLLARILLESGGARDQAIGKQLFIEQSTRGDSPALDVLRILSACGRLTPFEGTECLRTLKLQASTDRAEILTAAGFRAQILPYKREQEFTAAATEFLNAGGGILELSRWLSRQNAFTEILKHLTPELATTSRALALIYLDSLGALNRWADADSFLAGRHIAIDSGELAMYRARVADQSKQSRIAQLRWEQALEIQAKDPRKLLQLAEFARRAGNPEIAVRACRRTLEVAPTFSRSACEEMVRVREFDLEKLHPVLIEMAERYPEDLAVQNDLAYAGFLLEKRSETALERVRAESIKNTNYLSYKTTLALAALRNGLTNEAIRVFGPQPLPWTELLPHHKAVYAAAMGAAGEIMKARQLARSINLDALRAEEKELIRQLL